ncbi:MAG: tail fiber domain-containing protein [Bacteroidota bacterium]
MKKIILVLTLFCAGMLYAQNESSGAIATTITTPAPLPGETFRFGPGIVTQLDAGSAFDFNASQWFSLGRLNTGTQSVYGLRFQLKNRAVILGYQDVADVNPRLQWIGDDFARGTDLEFRVSNSFTSTNSTLVATMTNDGRTFFGAPFTTASGASNPLVGIDYSQVSGNNKAGLIVQNTDSGATYTGIKTVNDQKAVVKTGIDVFERGDSNLSTGVNILVADASQSIGTLISASSTTGGTFGVLASISSPSTTPAFGAAIFGNSPVFTNRFAGYFNGDIFVSGMILPSDEKLKQNIKSEENVLEKLSQLEAVTYTFKENEHLNLSKKLQHGFLAQNLEETFPELITAIEKPIFDKKDRTKQVGTYAYKAVNYLGMISILTSSLNELNEQSKKDIQQIKEAAALDMQQLKEEFNNQIEALEAQIAALKGEDPGTRETLNSQTTGELGFSMEQNKPNPFANQTVINYTLPKDTKATISVVDLSGKFIKDYTISNVKGQVTINASEIGKGIFIYALISNDEVIMTKKMIVR